MKVIYFWIAILVAIGVAFFIYLFPTKDDLALIYLRGKQFSAAEAYYREQYNKGFRTPDVVVALRSIEMKQGDIDQAINLMEDYVLEHPNDVYSLQLLADLYRADQRYNQFYETLIKIRELKPEAVYLFELAESYRAREELEGFCSVLEQLATANIADESNFMELAYCYASEKDFEKVYKTLQRRRLNFPKKVELDDVLFEIWAIHQVSAAQGGNEELEQQSMEFLKEYLLEKNNPKLVLYSLGSIRRYHPQHLNFIINELDPIIRQNPELEAYVISILWTKKEEQSKVFARLLKQYAERQLDPNLQTIFFDALIVQNYDLILIDLIRHTPPEQFNRRTILEIANQALALNKPTLAIEMKKALGEDYLEKNPHIAAFLDVAAQEEGAMERLVSFIATTQLFRSDIYALLRLTAEAKNVELSEQLGLKLYPYFGLSEDDLFGIAVAYIKIDRAEDYYQMLQKALPTVGKKKAGPAFALLNAALGRTKKTAEWIKEQKVIKEYMLSHIFIVAEEKKEYPLALYIAKRLYEENPSPQRAANYALALIHVGKIERGLALLQKLYVQELRDPSIESYYFNGLNFAARHNPKYADQLIALMEENEKRGLTTPAIMRDYVYIYIDILHDYTRAEEILQELADRDDLKEDDVQTLLYLWGPQLDEEKREWLVKKAEKSTREKLGFWLENLAYMGDYSKVIELFEQKVGLKCASKIKPSVYFSYLGALAYKKLRCELRQAVQVVYHCMNEIKDLKKLAQYAEQVQLYEIRREIWECVVQQEPCNVDAWYELGKAIFDQGDYCAAVCALVRYFDLYCTSKEVHPKLFESLYHYGEILEARQCYKEAKYFYFLSLCDIFQKCDKNYRMLEIQSLVLEKLNADDAALSVMNNLYEITSLSPDIAASFANLMMQMGDIKQAREFLYRGSGP